MPGQLRRAGKDRLAAELGLEVDAIGGIGDAQIGLRQERGTRDVFVLHAFRGINQPDLLRGILLDRQSNSLFEGEPLRGSA